MGKFNEKTINSKMIYKGRIVSLRNDEVALPNGKTSNREVVEHPGAAAIIALTGDNEVVLIRQFRKPVGEEILEIPAGLPEKGEEGIQTAKRELEEETGFKAKEVREIFKAYASPGYSSELITYYSAQGLTKTRQDLDRDEMIEVELVPFKKALKMVQTGKIKDNKTVLAILFVKEFILFGIRDV